MKNIARICLAIMYTVLLTILIASCGLIPGGDESHAVVKSFMEAAAAKELDNACACFAPTDEKSKKDVEELILNNYQLFEGYQDIKMRSIHVEMGKVNDTAEYSGEVIYTGDFKGWVEAKLLKVGEEWKLSGINVEISPEQLQDYLKRHTQSPKPTPTPSPKPIPTPSPTPIQTPSPKPIPSPSEPKLIYEDDFSDTNSGWLRESGEDRELGYEDGEYHILIKEFDSIWSLRWVFNRNAGRLTDFALEIDAKRISGKGLYEVRFRIQDSDNFYGFRVEPGGRTYSVGKNINGTGSFLQNRTESDFINTGNNTNRLKVICQGPQIEVYINGHHLTTVTDDSFTEGYVGMAFIATEQNSRVAFDNIRVYSLD